MSPPSPPPFPSIVSCTPAHGKRMPCALHSRMAGCPGGGQAGCEPACAQPYTALLLHNCTDSHVSPSVSLFRQFAPQDTGGSCWSVAA